MNNWLCMLCGSGFSRDGLVAGRESRLKPLPQETGPRPREAP
jgi:hypothetical protein